MHIYIYIYTYIDILYDSYNVTLGCRSNSYKPEFAHCIIDNSYVLYYTNYIYIYIHTHVYIYIYIYTYTYTYTYMYAYTTSHKTYNV